MQERSDDNLLTVLQVLLRWKKPILSLCALSTAAAVVLCLCLPNYYEATTVFYPSNPSLNAPNVLFGTSTKDMDFYGSGDDVDRLISLAGSNELKTYMIKRFNLYQHYEIDSSHLKAPHKVGKKFEKLYRIIKNERDAIELSVEDKNPEMAAQMANAAREKIDQLAQAFNQQTQQKLLTAFEENIRDKEKKAKILTDSLTHLREKYGVYLTGNETTGNLTTIKAQNIDAATFNKGFAKVQVLTALLEAESKALAENTERLEKLKTAFHTGISAMHLQDAAQVPVVKSRPKRSLIVLGVALLSLVLGALAALLFNNYKDVRWSDLANKQ